MDAPKSLTLLIEKCGRGRVVFLIIWIFAIICTATLLCFAGWRALSIVTFVIAVASALGLKHVRDRQALAITLINHPDLIYWVQPRTLDSNLGKKTLRGKEILRLFLENGDYLEAEVPSNEVSFFKEWLFRYSPNAKWGALISRENDDV